MLELTDKVTDEATSASVLLSQKVEFKSKLIETESAVPHPVQVSVELLAAKK